MKKPSPDLFDERNMSSEVREEVKLLEENLDLDHVGLKTQNGKDWMAEVEQVAEVVDLPADDELARRAEHKHFERFFNQSRDIQPEETSRDAEEQQREVERKFGSLATAGPEEVQRLFEEEEDATREEAIKGGMEQHARKEREGFEKRGRRPDAREEAVSRTAREKERQRTIRRDSQDRMCIGDVVVPEKFHNWVLDPAGDHSRRHRLQREKEERVERWIQQHGMYRKGKKETSFRRDPVFEEQTVRQRRVGILIQDALDRVFLHDLQHVKIPSFTIDNVKVTVDLKNARIDWNSVDDAALIEKFFWKHGPAIRHYVTERINLKFSPTFQFRRSDTLNKELEIDKILRDEQRVSEKQ